MQKLTVLEFSSLRNEHIKWPGDIFHRDVSILVAAITEQRIPAHFHVLPTDLLRRTVAEQGCDELHVLQQLFLQINLQRIYLNIFFFFFKRKKSPVTSIQNIPGTRGNLRLGDFVNETQSRHFTQHYCIRDRCQVKKCRIANRTQIKI